MSKTSHVGDRHVVVRPAADLRHNPRNARTHSARQIAQIADSIRAFGFVNPILIDEDGLVLAGHGRLAAAKRLGMLDVPTLSIGGMSDAQKRAYVLADNRLAQKAGWDINILAIELGELAILLPKLELDFSVEITGFAAGEIEVIGHDRARDNAANEDAQPKPIRRPPVSKMGDLWCLGSHRLLCGDARDVGDFDRLMRADRADMVFTDPPYNVSISGHVTRSGNHAEFAMASGEMTAAEYRTFLEVILANAVRVSRPGAIHDICMDWRHIAALTIVGEDLYDALLNLCVWNKGTAGQGSFYRSQHELVAIFRVRGAPHQNNVALGQFGRNRSNIWTYPGIAGFSRDRASALAMHPTVKPVALVADAIRDCTFHNHLVLDPFLGSGTTLIAAEKIGRKCYGTEYDAAYVDGIVQRWEAYTGGMAVLDGDGHNFAEIEAMRSARANPAVADAAID